MTSLTGQIFAIVGVLSLVIIFHEFGHLLVAKWRKLPVYEFSLGFGPIIWQRTIADTQYVVRPILLGGYVRIAGLDPGDEHPEGFDKHNGFVRSAVLLAGPLMNLVLAALIFTWVGLMWGEEVGDTTVVQRVLHGSPAAKAGLLPGDKVLRINGEVVDRFQYGDQVDQYIYPSPHPSLVEWVRDNPKQSLLFSVLRDGRELDITIVPDSVPFPHEDADSGRIVTTTIGQIGLKPVKIRKPVSPLVAVAAGVSHPFYLAKEMIRMLGWTVTGRAPAQVVGPVGITGMMRENLELGWGEFLSFSATLSVIIGVMNLLPFPGLDGGRLLFIAVEGVIRRRLNRQAEAIVHTVGIGLVLMLVLGITIKEVVELVTPK